MRAMRPSDELSWSVRDVILDYVDRGEGGAMSAVQAVGKALREVADSCQGNGQYVSSDILERAGDALRTML